MVSLEVYDAYAHHHQQNLMQAAQVSRDLRKKKYLSRGVNQNLPVLFAWFLNRLFSDTKSDTGKARSRVKEERRFTTG
jgi:hypothetical protein